MEVSGTIKLLLDAGFLSSEQEAENFLKESKQNNEHLFTTLIKNKKVNSLKLAMFFANKFSLPLFDLDMVEDIDFIAQFGDLTIEKQHVLPIKKTQNTIYVATSDPTKLNATNDIKFEHQVQFVNFIIVEHDKLTTLIEKILSNRASDFSQQFDENSDLSFDDDEESASLEQESDVEDAPIVKFISGILLEAVRLKVSDIHFEPYEKFYRLRFRLDGALYEKMKIPLSIKDKVASRIKVISKMDISEKRLPQDGKLKMKISQDKSIDFRVNTLPTLYGEKIVMRILDSSAANLDINILGYDELQKKRLTDAIKRPYGMILVTGPTGSGKTVSLYSCLNLLNKEDINISTAEDPAEINLPGINQVNVTERLDFATALKAFLRQDPDVIMVGEIRDRDTAEIAIKAAQTGHLVLSTLHTNDAPTTLTRLMNMEIAPFNIASSVILITAQRLARKLCPHCKEKEELTHDNLLSAGFTPEDLVGYNRSWHTYRAVGCDQCDQKGYKGRVGIYQVMPISEEMQKIILNKGTALDIADQARTEGVLSLRDAGLQKVKEGTTSLTEVENTTNIS
jgi:type IV pilus assembly protein PilB